MTGAPKRGYAFSRTRLRVLAARSARALLDLSPSFNKEGAGKTGCRLAPVAAVLNGCALMHREDTGGPEPTRPSLRNGWNGLCRDLPGETNSVATVALRIADAGGPVGSLHHHKA